MLFDLLEKNRSYRNFDSAGKISREVLEGLVRAARFCPSASNLQTLKYYLSCEEETNRQILEHLRFAGALKDKKFPYPGKEATAYVVICHDTRISASPERFWKDVGIVAQTMMLAAAELGLGGCMVGSMNQVKIQEVLSMPDNLLPQLILMLGKPAERVKIVTAEDGNVTYFREEDDTHVVPKRPLAELIINKE
ncbi:MAG TPA: nitroreductase [Clostridiales bacterium]|nr:nitroreductase [Clostridiales bacterium]